jgi:hypothetical protein
MPPPRPEGWCPVSENTCPECDGPAQVWADRSGGITVNFACDNPKCKSGKAPWDTPRPVEVTHD